MDAIEVGALVAAACVLVVTIVATWAFGWWRRQHPADGLLPNETFEYTLDTGDILQLFRDRSVLVAVLQDDGRRADMISIALADDVDFSTARMALHKAEQDGLRLVE